MDWIPIFFIGFSVCWYALQAHELFAKESPSRLQRLLGCIFVWWGLSTLKDLLFYPPHLDFGNVLSHVFFLDGCGAVTFALLLFELTMPGWVTRRRTALMLLPFLIFFVLHLFIRAAWFDSVFTVFFVSFAWVAMLIAVFKGRSYAHAIRQNYSDLEDVDISWMWYIMVAFFVCQHVWWIVSSTLDAVADSFYYVSSLVCWHFTLRGVNRLRPLRLPEVEVKPTNDVLHNLVDGFLHISAKKDMIDVSSSTTLASKKRIRNLAGRLEQLMEDERLYLNPDLTMADLTVRLGTNRTYLSEYLSTELNTTFYDYINRLRIERCVIPMIQTDSTLSLESIAAEAGFKSITTFRRAFRKLTGQLPSEYMRQ